MRISRRQVLWASSAAIGAASLPFSRLALAQPEPIRIGWLAALTGPGSAPSLGFNRGVMFATDKINAGGGVKAER